MKNIKIERKEDWKNFIMREAKYWLPAECMGGICVDAGCNIGDFELNYENRFDKYICFDVFQENVDECIKNTKELKSDIEVFKLAVWSESNKKINVYAYEWATDSDNLNQFGNSGNISCIETTLENGAGWKSENVIDVVNTISIDSIIENYGTINLLKIDVEGAEYEFLLNKDLSKINYITGEFHFDQQKQDKLNFWISKTHKRFKTTGYPDYFKLKTL
jgi:FkbM family methyltransferase